MSEQLIQLTVVQLDLFQSSKSTADIYSEIGEEGVKLFVKQIKQFVENAFSKNSEYDEFYSLGGDGYRISFAKVENAYEFVQKFCQSVEEYNKQPNVKQRSFRIGAATGYVLYDKSQSGLDRIIGHSVLFTVARLVTAKSGWFYIDEETFSTLEAVDKNVAQHFTETSVKGKEHEENIHAYCREMISSLQPFDIQVATIEQIRSKPTSKRQKSQQFIENLSKDIKLEMVKLEMAFIPGGEFYMGTEDKEIQQLCQQYKSDNFIYEQPLHKVNIKPFCLGRYPVTQLQWKAVTLMPQIERELNPEPSKFKGANRPVERISWYDAVEFCLRLAHYTNRKYRLPSEAEWEYACRAGTTTPFHFGEGITTDLVNFNGNYIYAAAEKGIYREETTPVDNFGVANSFGLFDMHGNVLEWCADYWHENYEGAPEDGSAWLNNDNDKRILRGGSWFKNPENCRSAYRNHNGADCSYDNVGFRVACDATWTE